MKASTVELKDGHFDAMEEYDPVALVTPDRWRNQLEQRCSIGSRHPLRSPSGLGKTYRGSVGRRVPSGRFDGLRTSVADCERGDGARKLDLATAGRSLDVPPR